ncbi:MAG TPA: BatD family protein [Thermoanaerobaculia bacterium]|nr:BatD family protein [Thermoanaerobaculia bacterium]
MRSASGRTAARLVAVLLSLVPASLFAVQEEPEVRVLVDNPRPASDDIVRLTYAFSGPGVGGSLRAPAALPLKNLVVVGGPNTSTQISFINGQLSRQASLTYFLKPSGTGPAEVGETTFKVGDKDVKAGAYLLEVGTARRAPGAGPGGPAIAEEDPFGRMAPRGGARRAGTERDFPAEDPILAFVATPSKETSFVGEEVTILYELVTQADVQGIEYVEAPRFPGLWAEDLERPERPTPRRDTWEGRPVARFTLLKKAVSGLTPGPVTLPPAKIRIGVRVAMDPFGDPFATLRPRVLERETKPMTLKILPIPGRPDFKGPVGQFGVAATVDRKSIPAGEAVTLKVRLAGSGNLRTATEAPHLSIPGVKVYPPSSRTLPARGATKGGTSAEWDFVVVPSEPGSLVIPPISLEVFDTAEKKLVVKRSEPITLTVEAGAPLAVASAGTAEASPAGAGKGSEASTTLPGTPPTPTPLPSARDLAQTTIAVPLWALIAAPGVLVAAGGAAWALRRRAHALGPVGALLLAEPGETKERAVARAERAIREHLARRTGASETSPVSALLDDLADRGIPPAVREELRQLLSQADFLRFAPQLGDYADEINRLREKTRTVLGRVRGTGRA